MFHDIFAKAAPIVTDNNLQLPSKGAQVLLAACTTIGKERCAPSSSHASPHAPPSSVIETASKQAIDQQQIEP